MNDLTASDLADRLGRAGVLVRIGPFVARLGTRLAELVDPIHLLYRHYELADEGGIVDFEVRVDPMFNWRRPRTRMARFLIDGEPAFAPFERKLALPMMEWALNWCLFTRPQHLFILHSAVVEKGGRAMLLPGRPGSGKSTLCAALVQRGWRLLSDEVAMMRPGQTETPSEAPPEASSAAAPDLIAAPLPMALKDASIDVIRRFEPSAVIGPATPDTRKGTVAHVQPPQESIERVNETARPAWIVFPAWSATAKLNCQPTSKARTLMRLADDAFNFSILSAPAFAALANLVDACGCYDLAYADLDDAIALLDRMAGGDEPSALMAALEASA